MKPVLKVEKIRKSYKGNCVVNDVSLEVYAGEIVGLLGPNGAGKTTIFHIIMGITKPDAGAVYLNGEEITSLPMHQRARRGIGFLCQEPSIFRRLTVEQNLLAILEFMPVSKKELKKIAYSYLEALGINHLAERRAETLSGGERRRLEIARTLLNSPSIFLLDEPFLGVDPISVVEIQQLMIGLKNNGIGILVTDHNVRDTLKITDRAYIIHRGKILISGSSEELASDPKAREIYLGPEFTL